jgi:hypothetical protein
MTRKANKSVSLVSALAAALLTVPAAPVAFAADPPARTASAPCAGGNPCAAKKRKCPKSDSDNPCAGAKCKKPTENPCAGKSK